jgi:hypothetical protein
MKRVTFALVLLTVAPSLAQAQRARDVLRDGGVKEGNCLVVDDDRKLALDLAEAADLRIHLVHEDQTAVDAARLLVEGAGKYGQIT